MVVYLDDIVIFSHNPKERTTHVRLVLQLLLENRLFVKAKKCVFGAASVEFLGHILEKGQVRADPKKVRAVEEWARPADRTQLRRFLGFANFYRRFILGFSRVAAPLTALTSSLRPFSGTPEAEDAFSTLMNLFTSALVLILPQPSRQLIIEVDASDVGIGPSFPSGQRRTSRSTMWHSCPAIFPQRNKTMTLGIGSYWPSTPPCRSGGIGSREPNTPSSYGRTIKTLRTFGTQSGWAPDRRAGPCFSTGLISP